MLVPTFEPSFFFSGEIGRTRVEPFGESYVFAELTPVSGIVMLGFMPVFAELIWTYAKSLRHPTDGRALAVALGVWSLCTANDIAVYHARLESIHLHGVRLPRVRLPVHRAC